MSWMSPLQFAGGAVGVVGVPVGDGRVHPCLVTGDRIVGEVVGPPADGVGQVGWSPSGVPHGGGGAVASRLVVDVGQSAGEPLPVLVEQGELLWVCVGATVSSWSRRAISTAR